MCNIVVVLENLSSIVRLLTKYMILVFTQSNYFCRRDTRSKTSDSTKTDYGFKVNSYLIQGCFERKRAVIGFTDLLPGLLTRSERTKDPSPREILVTTTYPTREFPWEVRRRFDRVSGPSP